MKKRNELTIIDIGSHKLEELFILLSPGRDQFLIYVKWFILKVLRTIRKLEFSTLFRFGKHLKILKYYFFGSRFYNIKIISIEPNFDVAYKYVKKLSKRYQVHYIPIAILGHDTKSNMELKKLYFYDHTISSSIYRRDRPIDEAKSTICVGLNFGILWDQLVKENVLDEDSPFLLRMNCEGAELGVIENCRDKKLEPLCIIGSLGDVGKIHGKKDDDKTMSILDEIGVPYYYFKGENPSTWYEMVDVWEHYTSEFIKR